MESRLNKSKRLICLTLLFAVTTGSSQHVSFLRLGVEAGDEPGWHRLQTQPKPSTLNHGLADIHTSLREESPSHRQNSVNKQNTCQPVINSCTTKKLSNEVFAG